MQKSEGLVLDSLPMTSSETVSQEVTNPPDLEPWCPQGLPGVIAESIP